MELNSSWEAVYCAATQELPSILWNMKVHYRVHKSPSLVSILSQIDPVHTTPDYLRSILILSTHLRLRLPSGPFPSGFPTNILYAFLFPHSCYMPCPSHPPWFDHSNYGRRVGKREKSRKKSEMFYCGGRYSQASPSRPSDDRIMKPHRGYERNAKMSLLQDPCSY
jgi:hypothetical protein